MPRNRSSARSRGIMNVVQWLSEWGVGDLIPTDLLERGISRIITEVDHELHLTHGLMLLEWPFSLHVGQGNSGFWGLCIKDLAPMSA